MDNLIQENPAPEKKTKFPVLPGVLARQGRLNGFAEGRSSAFIGRSESGFLHRVSRQFGSFTVAFGRLLAATAEPPANLSPSMAGLESATERKRSARRSGAACGDEQQRLFCCQIERPSEIEAPNGLDLNLSSVDNQTTDFDDRVGPKKDHSVLEMSRGGRASGRTFGSS